MLTKELLTTQINYIEKRSCYHGERERERSIERMEWLSLSLDHQIGEDSQMMYFC